MKLKPLGKRVLVEVFDYKEKVLDSGIVLPETVGEEFKQAEVICVGDEVTLIKEKDRVVFGKYSGMEIESEGKKCLLVKEEEILGIYE